MLRVAFALLFITAQLARAQTPPPSMKEAATQLASRIGSLQPRRTTVSLEFQTLTTLPPAEWSNFRAALEEELRKAGVEMTAATSPETRLRITVSENVHGLLLVAEAGSGDSRQVVMLPWSATPAAEQKARVKISSRAVWEQQDAILDVLLPDSGASLLVLSPSKMSGYRLAGGKWILSGAASIALARPLPRDPRGRIESVGTGFRIDVPGTACTGSVSGTIQLTCAPGNQWWPADANDAALQLRWVGDRNLLETEGVKSPFFSATTEFIAASDGRTVGRSGEPIGGAESWGSDFTTIENSCDSTAVVLATGTGDNLDRVQAFQVANGQAIPASEPLTLAGPATALWPAEVRGQATLVIRNSKTGNYEASRLGVSCAE